MGTFVHIGYVDSYVVFFQIIKIFYINYVTVLPIYSAEDIIQRLQHTFYTVQCKRVSHEAHDLIWRGAQRSTAQFFCLHALTRSILWRSLETSQCKIKHSTASKSLPSFALC